MSVSQCAQSLAERFPALFGAEAGPKPVKLRIHVDIQARAPGVFSRRLLAAFLSRHTTTTPYLKALVQATQRVDLDGNPAGEILPEHRQAAEAELARRRDVVKARRQQERDAQRQHQRPQQSPKERSQKVTQERPQQPLQQRGPQGRPQGGTERAARPPRPAERPAPQHLSDEERQRAELLRAFETTTLTKANFCALKGWKEAALDEALNLARQERASRGR